jgi:uncharacterized repeat protein (TIGR02543 family)
VVVYSRFSSAMSGKGVPRKKWALTLSASLVSLFLVSAPLEASGEYDGTTGSVNCTTGSFTIQNNVVTTNNDCAGTAVVPVGVTAIGNSAFQNSEILLTVSLPASLISIEDYAFYNTSALASVTIPASVTSIGNEAFNDARSLSSITIPPSVTSIGNRAFSGTTSLTNVAIPASVTSIGYGPFAGATSLASISVHSGNSNYLSRDGVLFNKSGTELIQFPAGKAGVHFTIPTGVTIIREMAFSGANMLVSVSIPATVTAIQSGAFSRATSLTSITIPTGVSSIASWTFSGATSLTSVLIPSTVTSIGEGAFNEVASLESITIPASVTLIDYAFDAPALRSVFFLGDAPTTYGIVPDGRIPQPTAYIRSNARGFGSLGGTWKGLVVAVGVFQVTFDSNGGSNTESALSKMGSSLVAPTPPTRSGYIFDGWSRSPNGPVVSFPYSLTGDMTLFANWTAITKKDESSLPPQKMGDSGASAVNLAARTIRQKTSYDSKGLAKRIGVKVISKKATVIFLVSRRSKDICVKSGSKLRTLKRGNCTVVFKVQEPRRKNGKLPKATTTTETLIIK